MTTKTLPENVTVHQLMEGVWIVSRFSIGREIWIDDNRRYPTEEAAIAAATAKKVTHAAR